MDEDRVFKALTDITAGMARLDVRMTGMEARLSSMEAGQDRLRVDLMARMDRLQTGQDQLRDESLVNFETMVRTERSVAGAIAGLRDEVRYSATQVEALTAEQRTLIRMIRRIDARVAALEEDDTSPSTGH